MQHINTSTSEFTREDAPGRPAAVPAASPRHHSSFHLYLNNATQDQAPHRYYRTSISQMGQTRDDCAVMPRLTGFPVVWTILAAANRFLVILDTYWMRQLALQVPITQYVYRDVHRVHRALSCCFPDSRSILGAFVRLRVFVGPLYAGCLARHRLRAILID
jgi:hypothetical protein